MTVVQALRQALRAGLFLCCVVIASGGASAAPYAAMVIDARDGTVLHARNADTRLHPASLTKMMTLYIAFQAIESGEIDADHEVTISSHAASEPPSKLGLRAGQKIKFRYLIRAAAVKSANDAATAIGEALEGSEAAFARRMTRTAQSLGMTNTTFRNANGLTEAGHLSTARDMTTLGLHLFYDFPEYYNIFSRPTTSAGIKQVTNTNRRLLSGYRGADGIKTGYTRAAGYNLVASAERGQERIIVTVFGGTSVPQRTAKVAELLDLGFSRAPSSKAIVKPGKPSMGPVTPVGALVASLRPQLRPGRNAPAALASLAAGIDSAIADAVLDDIVAGAGSLASAVIAPTPAEDADATGDAAVIASLPADAVATGRPQPRPGDRIAEAGPATGPASGAEIVARRDPNAGLGGWSITLGKFGSRNEAERKLLQTALTELSTLDEAQRSVVSTKTGYAAHFVGLSEDGASRACARLRARDVTCEPIGPS